MARGRRIGMMLAGAGLVLGAMVAGVPAQAHADPVAPEMNRTGPAAPLKTAEVTPGMPMPVPHGAFGYLATRNATLWLAAQKPGQAIRAIPVPPNYQAANTALAKQVDRELQAAAKTKGACVQIIIDPQVAPRNLFSYGVWSVAPEYCPRG